MSNTATPKRRSPLAELPIHVLLACVGALLLSWPIIQVAGEHGMMPWATYLFAVWAGIILLLAAIGRALARHPAPPTAEETSNEASGRKKGTA